MYSSRILAISASTLVITVAGFGVAAHAAPNPLSDRLLVTDPAGVTIYDNSMPETATAGETTLTFAGGPANVPPPIPIATAVTIPGVAILVLTEAAPDPTEPPLVLPGPGGNVLVSDVVVSTLTVAGIPSFVSLVSDGDPVLQQILTSLVGNPNLKFIPETGKLEDVTNLVGGINSPLGPVQVMVQSDAPEPELLLLLGSALALLCTARTRPRVEPV